MQYDEHGFGIAILTIVIVFVGFIVLYLLFSFLGRAYNIDFRKRLLIKKGKFEEAENLQEITSGEVNAAIALALHIYKSRLRSNESTRLTIERVAKSYSPWSSKIYGLRKDPK